MQSRHENPCQLITLTDAKYAGGIGLATFRRS
jgi:hypothetical protein